MLCSNKIRVIKSAIAALSQSLQGFIDMVRQVSRLKMVKTAGQSEGVFIASHKIGVQTSQVKMAENR